MSAADMISAWAVHLRRMMLGRPTWSAKEEFAFYSVTPELVALHRARQHDLVREAHATGLSIIRSMGILDTDRLSDKVVLDVGAGECALSLALAGPGGAKAVWALEATPKQIWAAADQAQQQGPRNLHCVIGDAQSLPFVDQSFDLVVANLVLHHIHPLEGLLREIARVLRPGGMFVAFEPNPVTGALTHQATSANEAPISPHAITSALRASGFGRVESTYWWTRGGTSTLGALSPGYRVRAERSGTEGPRSERVLARELQPLGLPGLSFDPQCSFSELVHAQAAEIAKLAALGPTRER